MCIIHLRLVLVYVVLRHSFYETFVAFKSTKYIFSQHHKNSLISRYYYIVDTRVVVIDVNVD